MRLCVLWCRVAVCVVVPCGCVCCGAVWLCVLSVMDCEHTFSEDVPCQ